MENPIENKDEISFTTATPHQVPENRLQVTTQQVTHSNQEERSTCWLLLSVVWNVLCLIVCINIGILAEFLILTQCALEIGDAKAGLILIIPQCVFLILLAVFAWLANHNRLTTYADIFDNPYLVYFAFLCSTKFGSSEGVSFISSRLLLGFGIMSLNIFIVFIGFFLIKSFIRRSEVKLPSENKTLAITIAVISVAAPLICWGPKWFVLSLASQPDNQVSWLMDDALLIYNLITFVASVLGMLLDYYLLARKFTKNAIQVVVCLIVELLMLVIWLVTNFSELNTIWFHGTWLFCIFMLLSVMLMANIRQHTGRSRQAMIKCLFLVLFVAIVSISLVGVVSDNLKTTFVIPTANIYNVPASETTNFTMTNKFSDSDDIKQSCTTFQSSIKSVKVGDDLKALGMAITILQICGLLFALVFPLIRVILGIFLRNVNWKLLFSRERQSRIEQWGRKWNRVECNRCLSAK